MKRNNRTESVVGANGKMGAKGTCSRLLERNEAHAECLVTSLSGYNVGSLGQSQHFQTPGGRFGALREQKRPAAFFSSFCLDLVTEDSLWRKPWLWTFLITHWPTSSPPTPLAQITIKRWQCCVVVGSLLKPSFTSLTRGLIISTLGRGFHPGRVYFWVMGWWGEMLWKDIVSVRGGEIQTWMRGMREVTRDGFWG